MKNKIIILGLLLGSAIDGIHAKGDKTEALVSGVAEVKKVVEITKAWRDEKGLQILNDFRELLALKNVASNFDDMSKNADWIESYLAKRNFKTKRLIEGGAPYVFGERKTLGATKTVLIYAHYDGQPVKPENWASQAWQPVIRDNLIESGGKRVKWPEKVSQIDQQWRIFARSAGDDKAPVIGTMAAIDALDAAGIMPSVNIKVLFDGEEEISSPSLKSVLAKHADLLETDLMLFCDGPMHQSRKRQLVFGVRGVTGLDITTYGPIRPLHSGHYGNWSQNSAENMVRLLATFHDENGKVAIKDFYNDVLPVTKSEKAAINAMPNIDELLKSELALYQSRLADTRIEEALMQPGAVITGIQVGTTGKSARNVIVSNASAAINFRLVPNQTPDSVKQKVEAHLRSLGYQITYSEPTEEKLKTQSKLVKLNWKMGYPSFRASLDSPMAKKLKSIMTEMDGEEPLMTPTMGGSLPIYLFENAIDAPIIILPIANHDNNQHGPNENLRIKNLWDAIDLYALVLTQL